MYIHSYHAGWRRNFHTSLNNGEIIVRSRERKHRVRERYVVDGGEVTESIVIEGKHKRHMLFGEYLKVYRNRRLMEEYYYNGEWRMAYKGLFYRRVKKDCIVERYASGGRMCREVVSWKNKNLMYSIGKGNKNIEIFNKDKTLLARIKLSSGFPMYSGRHDQHLDVAGIKKLRASFNDGWYYELYNSRGKMCSWLKGTRSRPEDGCKGRRRMYFIRGIQVPRKVKEGKYDAEYILSYPNVTIRSEMMKKYGIERIIQELKGNLLEKNEEYELLQFPVPGGAEPDQVMNILKVKCPSARVWYPLRVPPQCQNINEALNWTYGYNLDEIRKGKAVDILGAT